MANLLRPTFSKLLVPSPRVLLLMGVVSAVSLPKAFAARLRQAQAPFLFSPYYGSVSVNSRFDHEYPNYGSNNIFYRYDGQRWTNPPDPVDVYHCTDGGGNRCYDGHDGMDFGVRWQPVLSAASGDVTFANWYKTNHTLGLGLYVEIDHRNGYKTQYGHISAIGGDLTMLWQPARKSAPVGPRAIRPARTFISASSMMTRSSIHTDGVPPTQQLLILGQPTQV